MNYKFYKLLKPNGKREYMSLAVMLLGSIICVFCTMFFMRVVKTSQLSTRVVGPAEEEVQYVSLFHNPEGKTSVDAQAFLDVKGLVKVTIEYPQMEIEPELKDENVYTYSRIIRIAVYRSSEVQDGNIILPIDLLNTGNYSIGQKFTFLDKEYTIAGRSVNSTIVYIPLLDGLMDGKACTSATLVTNTELSRSARSKLADGTGLVARSSGAVDTDSNFWAGLVYMIIATALCLYNVYLAFEYSLKLKKRKYTACALSGAELRSLESLIFVDGLWPVLAGGLIGFLLNISLYKAQQKAFEEIVRLSFWNVLFCIGLVVVVALAILFIKLAIMRKRSYFSEAAKV